MSGGTTLLRTVGSLVVAAALTAPPHAHAQENARMTTEAYIYLYPDSTRKPFGRLEADSLVTILGAEGDWFNISIVDAKGERRYGYVRQRAIERLPPTLRTTRTAPPVETSRATDTQRAAMPAAEPSRPETTPSAQPKAAATTATPRAAEPIRLQDIRMIFIEPMPHDLDQYIRAEIIKKLNGRLVVVLNRDAADGVLRGAAENRTGIGSAITGRYLGLHDNASASVSLVDLDETVVLWASEAGDRSLMWSSLARGGQRKVADRLVNNLKKALIAR